MMQPASHGFSRDNYGSSLGWFIYCHYVAVGCPCFPLQCSFQCSVMCCLGCSSSESSDHAKCLLCVTVPWWRVTISIVEMVWLLLLVVVGYDNSNVDKTKGCYRIHGAPPFDD
jgi:hypothetical protein